MSTSALSGKARRGAAGGPGLAMALYVATAMAVIAAALAAPLSAYALNLLMQATTYAIAVLGLTIVLGYTFSPLGDFDQWPRVLVIPGKGRERVELGGRVYWRLE